MKKIKQKVLQRILRLTMLWVMMCSSMSVLTVNAGTVFKDGSLWYEIISSTDARVTTCRSGAYSGDIVVPATCSYSGTTYNVVAISNKAFYQSNIQNVTLPTSVKTIGEYAFQESSVTSINLENCTTLGVEAFKNCDNLTAVDITSCTDLGKYAFKSCDKLKTVELMNTLSIWSESSWPSFSEPSKDFSAFQGCTSFLKFIVNIVDFTEYNDIPYYFSSGEYTYKYNGSVIEDLVLPSDCTELGSYLFYGSQTLKSIDLSNCTSINPYTFYGCSNLTNIGKLINCKYISEYAFYDTKLSSVIIPSCVKSIGSCAFGGSCNTAYLLGFPSYDISFGTSTFALFTTISYDFPGTFSEWLTYFKDRSVETKLSIPNNAVATRDGSGFGPDYNITTLFPNVENVIFRPNVSNIGSKMFYAPSSQYEKLKSMELQGENVSIGDNAFSSQTKLTSLELKGGSIGQSAFSGCEGLTSIDLNCSSIGIRSFMGCTGLTSVKVCPSVQSVGLYAFSGCPQLKSITIDSNTLLSATYSEGATLYDLFGEYITHVTLSDNVTTIGTKAFYGEKGLTEITIGKKVNSIASDAFTGCTNLKKATINSNDLTSNITSYSKSSNIGTRFDNVEELTFGSAIEKIGTHAFNNDQKLKKIILDGCTPKVGLNAFANCGLLSSIEGDIESVSLSSFANCSSLSSISITAQNDNLWGNAFEGCKSLTSASIQGTYSEVPHHAFYNCEKLSGIAFSMPSPGQYSFAGCKELTAIIIPSGTIGESAFEGCEKLKYVSLEDGSTGVTEIEANAFKGTIIEGIRIPTTMQTLHDNAFAGCARLTSMNIESNAVASHDYGDQYSFCDVVPSPASLDVIFFGQNVTAIGENFFDGNTDITEVTFRNAPAIGFAAFRGCENLMDINGSVRSVTEQSFKGSTCIEKISITNDETIDESAFEGCTSLTSVTLPSNLTTIESKAFKGCSQLPEIVIPTTVSSLATDAFAECTNLNDVTINSPSIASNSNYKHDPESESIAIYFYNAKTITFGPQVNQIADHAFYGDADCGYPEHIIFQYDGGVEIGEYCFFLSDELVSIEGTIKNPARASFFGSTKLESITIAKETTSIGSEAFRGCSALKTVTCLVEDPTILALTDNMYVFKEVPVNQASLLVPIGSTTAYQNAEVWRDFTDIHSTSYILKELVDGVPYNNAEDLICSEIRYKRNYNNTNWQALYIPFPMRYQDWCDDFDVAYINNMNQYDTDDDGEADLTLMELIKVKSGKLEANEPYLIRAKEVGEKTLTTRDAVLYAAEETGFDVSSRHTLFTFAGTYSGLSGSVMYSNGYYAMGNGALVQAEDASADLKPMRWYMEVTDRNGSPVALGSIRIAVRDEDEPMGIEPIGSEDVASQRIYDLQGRHQSRIMKGMNIVNGKKVLLF